MSSGPHTSLLRHNTAFRRLLGAQATSILGDWFFRVALLGKAYALAPSGLAVSLMLVASSLPALLLSPLTGLLADRLDRRRLMVVCDVMRAAVLLGAVPFMDSFGVLVAVAVTLSLFQGAFGAARQAILPSVVEHGELANANALSSSVWGMMMVVGATLGGVTSAAVGHNAAFIIDAVSFLGSGVLLAGLTVAPVVGAQDRANDDKATAGLHFLRRNRFVLSVMLVGVSWGLVGGAYQVLLPLLALQGLRVGDMGLGLLYAVDGMGVLAGSWLVMRGHGIHRQMAQVFGAAYLAQAIFFAALAWASSLAFALPLVFLMRLAGGVVIPLDATLLQQRSPPHLLGRIFALHGSLYGALMQASMLAVGGLSTLYPASHIAAAAGALGVLVGGVWLLALLGGMLQENEHPQEHSQNG